MFIYAVFFAVLDLYLTQKLPAKTGYGLKLRSIYIIVAFGYVCLMVTCQNVSSILNFLVYIYLITCFIDHNGRVLLFHTTKYHLIVNIKLLYSHTV